MKSLNDALWDKDGKEVEENKKDIYNVGMRDTCLTDNCACAYDGRDNCFPFYGFQKACN